MQHVASDGAEIPAIGLGTWTLSGDTCRSLVAEAIRSGYRHIDTAAIYDNEAEVGAGIRASGIAREEIFLTTKVWYTDLAPRDARRSVESSLKRLGLDYVDLILIHWPSNAAPLADTLEALHKVREDGLARHIGVSNFPSALLRDAVAVSRSPIVCNQVEYHPHLGQTKVLSACRELGLALVSYCPLGRGAELFGEPVIQAAARAHARTPAQIVLRWHVQQEGVAAIPRSSRIGNIRANLDVFDFRLSDDEMRQVSRLARRNRRICDFAFSPRWDAA